MSEPTREELLTLALGVLPELPRSSTCCRRTAAASRCRLVRARGRPAAGYAPRGAMRDDLHLLARVYRPRPRPLRGRVRGRRALLPQHPRGAGAPGGERRPPPQGPPRLPTRRRLETGNGERQASAARCPRDTELEVRLVDISATGCAFVTQKRARNRRPGARAGRPVRPRHRPRGARRAHRSGALRRYRAGCEITEISDLTRKTISALADAERRGRFGGPAQSRRRSRPAPRARAAEHSAMLGPPRPGRRSRTRSASRFRGMRNRPATCVDT